MRIDLKVPTSFAGLRPDQLQYFCKVILQHPDPAELKLLCLMNYTGLKVLKAKKEDDPEDGFRFKYQGKSFYMSSDMVTDILSRLDFLTQPPGLFNPPEAIKNYRACDSRLFGVRLDEWLFADLMYSDFSKTQDDASLNKMLAVFYRRKTDDWAEGKHIEQWAKRFKRVPMPVKYSVYLWYTGVKSWLITKYYYVFQGGSGADDVSADEMIMGILSNLNEGKVADNGIIKASEMHEALYELNRKIEYIKNLKTNG